MNVQGPFEMMGAGAGLRFGAPAFAYAAPLVHALEREPGVSVAVEPSCVLKQQLMGGRLDCALLPVFDCLALENARAIPGLGVAAHGPSETEGIAGPAGAVGPVNYTHDLDGFVPVVQSVLAEIGASPVEFAGPGLEVASRGEDTHHLVWGAAHAAPVRLDVARAWTEHTGLPLVYGLWMGRTHAPYARLRRILGSCLRDVEPVGESTIRYVFGMREMEGLRLLIKSGVQCGVCGESARIVLC